MCDVDDEMGRAEIAMAGYSVSCSVKPARDGVNPVMREGGGQKAVVRYHDSELRCCVTEYEFSAFSPQCWVEKKKKKK